MVGWWVRGVVRWWGLGALRRAQGPGGDAVKVWGRILGLCCSCRTFFLLERGRRRRCGLNAPRSGRRGLLFGTSRAFYLLYK